MQYKTKCHASMKKQSAVTRRDNGKITGTWYSQKK